MMTLGRFITIICLAFGLSSVASTQTPGGVVNSQQNPFDNIEQMTGQLLIIIDKHKDRYPANEEAYFEALNTLMTGFVDFNFVAKKVMGKYAKSSSKVQRARFEVAFRQGLVETYGRGLMSYGNEKIVLINKQALADKQRRVVAKQEIRSEAAVYPLQYLMYQKKATGEWNVVNVTLNG
jgi:phospholipid transport system substrate-binding protein